MLPGDTRARREATVQSGLSQQSMMSDHFEACVPVTPYSDQAFEATAIEWLVHSNQVCLCTFSSGSQNSNIVP